jgi:hypothetical protein
MHGTKKRQVANRKAPALVTIPALETFAGICRKQVSAGLAGFHNRV